MFGFGLTKLLILALIIGAVWYGYKWLSRRDELADAIRRKATGGDEKSRLREAHDMVKCPVCTVYVASGKGARCARADCPYET